ncbi:MAG: hypothetical protein EHM20_16230 [Alphaproteobacteria bacterium]|nr:MAG: hypothetical protein EHM20_16230 [Alphaproteobacteria bacterium]
MRASKKMRDTGDNNEMESRQAYFFTHSIIIFNCVRELKVLDSFVPPWREACLALRAIAFLITEMK